MEDTTFTALGRQWSVVITDDVIARAQSDLGLDVRQLAAKLPRQVLTLMESQIKRGRCDLGGLLWLAVEQQAMAVGVDPEQFVRSLNYARINSAIVALLNGIAARFPMSRLAIGMKAFNRAEN